MAKMIETWPNIEYNTFNRGGRVSFAKKDILDLSVSERIQLVQDIWDGIAQVPESVLLTEEEKAEINRRLDAYHNDPSAGPPWLMVWERIKSRA